MIKAEHVVPHVYGEASGVKMTVLRVCQAVKSYGVDVRLHVLEPASVAGHEVTFDIETYAVEKWTGQRSASSAMLRGLRDAAQTADIMHNHGLWMMPNVYPGKSVQGTGCQLVCSTHGNLSQQALKRSYWKKCIFWYVWQRRVLKRCRCFHATAQGEALDIRRLGFTQPIALIPNGVDIPEDVTRRHRHEERRKLLFVGRLNPIKGVDLLVRAWARVCKRFPDWELVIVGPDFHGSLQKTRALADELEADRVSLLGPLYNEDKRQAYLDADLYVLPSHTENFGLTIAEALAHGVPVITTKGTPWEGLPTHDCGWWIEVGEEPLVRCLEEALAVPRDELDQLGQRGRSWMAGEFSWNVVGQMMADTYRWLVDGGQHPGWVEVA